MVEGRRARGAIPRRPSVISICNILHNLYLHHNLLPLRRPRKRFIHVSAINMTFARELKMNNNGYPSEKGARTIAVPSTNNEMLPRSRVRRWVAGFTVMAFFYFLWSFRNPSPTSPFYGRTRPCDHTLEDTTVVGGEKVADRPLVPFEAHIMSKCPDAQVRHTGFLPATRLCPSILK